MRILITNDDSVSAEQLLPLVEFCKKLGEITVMVPKIEQSGKSHGIEIHRPFEVQKVQLAPDIEVYTVDSTPADCVRFAILGLNMEFDLVISGINRGYNVGMDILYSGTVSAVREAALLGVSAIALSTSFEDYDSATDHLDEVFAYIEQNKLLKHHNLYNINIPKNPKGIVITKQGGKYYSDTFEEVEKEMFIARGKSVYEYGADHTLDTDAVTDGYVSITPLTIDVTDYAVFKKLTEK